MALDEYKRKRHFDQTPEPLAALEKPGAYRFVVQKHRASHLHYDFRLEVQGVLKSWAVPKGPSLNPADKRLAMMVEDHPVSYIDFEGVIPPGNYGAGSVIVWDIGTWEPLGDPTQMLQKGDLKFNLKGKKLKGSFVLAHIRSRRPGSKGNEWLLIKHRDEYAVQGYDIDQYDGSALTGRSLAQIAGDEDAATWQSNRPAVASRKNAWLADTLANLEKKKRTTSKTKSAKAKASGKALPRTTSRQSSAARSRSREAKTDTQETDPAFPASPAGHVTPPSRRRPRPRRFPHAGEDARMTAGVDASATGTVPAPELDRLSGSRRAPIPRQIHPMLATLIDQPFNDAEWLYEVKWDGYRAIAFIEGGKVRLVSRNQNDLTEQYPEVADLGTETVARTAILDGEICALDEEGRPSFSLMQRRTGGLGRRRRGPDDRDIPLVYYVFDLLYLDGFDLRRVDLSERKRVLRQILRNGAPDAHRRPGVLRYSDDFAEGIALYRVARERGLEGIVAKRRRSCYLEKRSREWLKIKITQRQECVIGGYTDPRGSRENFGSIVLGLYEGQGRLIHVGQAGSGFTERTHEELWRRLKTIGTDRSPFFGKVESDRRLHWVKPELVAQIKFTEWTHEGESGQVKMRAPVFEGLRFDKTPRECVFETPRIAKKETEKAQRREGASRRATNIKP
jgi:bifunctional non-homologous end joining protein LigD